MGRRRVRPWWVLGALVLLGCTGCRILAVVPRLMLVPFSSLSKMDPVESPAAPIEGGIRAGAAAMRLAGEELRGVPLAGYIDRILRGRAKPRLPPELRGEDPEAAPPDPEWEDTSARDLLGDVDGILDRLRSVETELEDLGHHGAGCSLCTSHGIAHGHAGREGLLHARQVLAWKDERTRLEAELRVAREELGRFLAHGNRVDPPRPHRLAVMFPPNRGVRPTADGGEAIRVKALSLVSGGRRMVWVSFDTCMVDEALVADVQARLDRAGLGVDLLLMGATHTHSGPGGFLRRAGLWFAGGLFNSRLKNLIVRRITETVAAAIANETSAVVGWSTLRVEGKDVVRSRRPGELAAPREFSLLRVARRAAPHVPVAALVVGGVHSTVLDSENRDLLSADLAGSIEREVQRRLAPVEDPERPAIALFYQGAGGDMQPGLADPCEAPDETLARIAATVAREVVRAFDEGLDTLEARPEIDWVGRRWRAGIPRIQCVRPCRFRNAEGRIERVPECPTRPREKVTKGFYLPLPFPTPGLLPQTGPVTGVRIGSRTLVTVPAEPTMAFGERIRGLGILPHVELVSLVGGYMGYVATTEQYARRCGESCATMYGERTAVTLWRTVRGLLRDLARRRDGLPPPPEPDWRRRTRP